MAKGTGKFVFGAVLGTIAGAVAGILLAPKSGKETRKIIKDKADDYTEKGKKFVAKEIAKEKKATDKIIEKGEKTLIKEKDAISDLAKKEEKAAQDLVQKVSDNIEKD